MTIQTQRESATIYQFPARGRFASATPLGDGRQQFNSASSIAHAALGGAWYHDEAIREDEQPRKN